MDIAALSMGFSQMNLHQQARKQLEEHLEKVNARLQILDMIEEQLFQMKKLAQIVMDEGLTDKEIQEINK